MQGNPLNPPVPPTPALTPAQTTIAPELYAEAEALTQAVEYLYADLIRCIGNAATVYQDCANSIKQGLVNDVKQYDWLYQFLGTNLSSGLLAGLGWPQMIGEMIGLEPVNEDEIRDRVGLMPEPMPPLPVPPPPEPGLPPVQPLPIRQVPVPGGPFVVPQLPGRLPPQLPTFGTSFPVGTAPPIYETKPPKQTVPSAPVFAPLKTPPERSVPNVQAPAPGPDWPTGYPTDTGQTFPTSSPLIPAPAPGSPPGPAGPPEPGPPDTSKPTTTRPVITLPVKPPPPVRQPVQPPPKGGASETPGPGRAAPPTASKPVDAAQRECPPVNVVINCAPGVKAEVGGTDASPGPPDTAEASPGAQYYFPSDQQFIGVPGEGSVLPTPKDTETEKEKYQQSYQWKDPSIPFSGKQAQRIEAAMKEFMRIDVCADPEKIAGEASAAVESFFLWLTGSKTGAFIADESVVGSVWAKWPGWLQNIARMIAGSFIGSLTVGPRLAGSITGCDATAYTSSVVVRSFFEVIERWVGARFPEVQTRLNQFAGQICPVQFPTADEADEAWLRDYISTDLWRCYVRAAGVDDVRHVAIRDAKAAKPGAGEMVAYARRLGFDNEGARHFTRSAGVSEDWAHHAIWKLSEFVPAPGDLISFMVRDVFDEEVVKTYGYDEEFATKFAGKAREWAYSQGMTEEQFLFYWRSHWQLPSASQAYEMMQRLRVGRVPPELVVTKNDAEKLLEINDVPEYWRRRLVEIAYNPLVRTDLRRAYFIGALSDDEIMEGIQDLGYNKRDSELLFKYWGREKLLWQQNQRPFREYVSGMVTESDFELELDGLGYTDVQILQVKVYAGIRQRKLDRTAKAKSVRNRVLRGLMDSEEAKTALQNIGFAAWQAQDRVEVWTEERAAKGRQATAAALCEWWNREFITTDEYADALKRVGYSASQIALIIATCREKAGENAKKKIARETAALERSEKRVLSEKQREVLRANAEKARAARISKAKLIQEERVQRRLAGAAAHLAKRIGPPAERYAAGVWDWFNALVEKKGYTRDGASQMIDNVVVETAIKAGAKWEEAGKEFVLLLPNVKEELPDED